MKKITLLLCLISLSAVAQGNLQFNQIINLKSGDTYQVPSNKVLKIESITIQTNSLCMPRTSSQNNNCGSTDSEGTYAGFTYMTIGDLDYSVPTKRGRDLFSSGCSALASTNPSCFPINNIDLGSFNTPIWLRDGKQVSINAVSISVLISAIEFNIVP